jgi:acyl-coenzyme A thioesterase PaaI-like protein
MREDAPAGFELFTRPSPLLDPWRPIFAKTEADRLILGVHLREAHTNSRATAHGGLIAALADQAMGMSCGVKLRAEGLAVANLWTTSLSVDYLGAAKIGQWLAFDTIFSQVGKVLCHAEIDVAADGVTVARGRAAFRVALSKDGGA